MTLRARFVDSISAAPTVRLDLTTSPWGLHRTTRFPPPAIKRSRVSTLLADGSQYPASAYGDRVLELHLQLEESTSDAAATAVQDLAQELDRHETNFFEYRLPDQSESVFFRTVRLAMESVDIITDGTLQRIICPVIAEPFGYGLEQTLTDVTVSTDPADTTNDPTYFDVSGVLGDVEAPMRIKRQQTGGGSIAFNSVNLLAVRRRGTVADVPYLLQAEDMTQGTDTSVQANDTDMSGAGSNYSRCDFSTDATMASRLEVDEHPSSASVDSRGIYRVFARFRKTAGGDVFRAQVRAGGSTGSGTQVELPEVELGGGLVGSTGPWLLDMGLLQVPQGVGARFNGPSGDELAIEGVRVELWAARDSGSGSLDVDYLLFVPADDRLAVTEMTSTWNTSADSGVVFDSFNDVIYVHRDTGGAVVNNGAGQATGDLPMVSPGVTNRIYFHRNVGPDVLNAVTTSDVLELSYWPRYLSVRGD